MPKADRVLSTPPTNTSAASAPGAVQLSSQSLIPLATAAAGQGVKNEPEPTRGSGILGSGAAVNRRSVMNMLVGTALAGTVVPAVAAPNPDAEIIAAGQKFEELLGRYVPAWLNWARLHREAKAETVARFGEGYSSPAWTKPEHGQSPAQKYLHEALARNGTTAAEKVTGAFYDEMEPLAGLIRDAETQTMAGLRAKALVAIFDCKPMCAKHDGYFTFTDEISHWSLFNGVIAVTGLSDLLDGYVELFERDATVRLDA
jgi:hypothetical protein